MKKRWLPILFLAACLGGCTGSGAVNPLTPKKASESGASSSAALNETVYWSAFPADPPVTATLQGLCLVSSSFGYACGNGGTVLQYDGTTWKKVPTGVDALGDLYACSFPTESDGWIVGGHGMILGYHGGKWALESSGVDETLYDVVVTKTRRGWAVGTNGTLLNYNGVSWNKVELGTKADLFGVGLSGNNSGWAVGDRGTLVKYDGSTWTVSADSPVSDKLVKVAALSDVEAWAVGAYGNFARFNGTAWSRVPGMNAQDLYDVAMIDSQDGWAVGQDGMIQHYDGSRWVIQSPVAGKPALNAVAFLNHKLGFAVGQNGTILKYQPGGLKASAEVKFSAAATLQKAGEPPVWTAVFSLVNAGGKSIPDVDLRADLPKGFHPVTVKASPAPAGKASSPGMTGAPPAATAVVTPSPTPASTVSATATPTAPSPEGTPPSAPPQDAAPGPPGGGPGAPGGAPGASRGGSAPTKGPWTSAAANVWKWSKGSLTWTFGGLEPTVSKSVTVTLTRDAVKDPKKAPPLIVTLTCVSGGKDVAESIPFHLEAALQDAASDKAGNASPAPSPTTQVDHAPDQKKP